HQDFSGFGFNPLGTNSSGSLESFLDAASIAAQGNQVYDANNFVNHPLPRPCQFRIFGVAPSAQVAVLSAGDFFLTTNAIVQAIQWAVAHDHVDVLNESFGADPYPDPGTDPIRLTDDAAVAAGVTVTVSSGDQGAASTIGSPASDPNVITLGATTQYRSYQETSLEGIVLGNGGYVSNNTSPISSAGFTQFGPRTIDAVAPGESGWIPFGPSSFTLVQGTSESAPLTAAEAALIIQAYRGTHGGASPRPALIKQFIMSSATDLGIPANEQGAGLINAYRAVQMALSYKDTSGSPTAQGSSLLVTTSNNRGAFSLTDLPNTARSFTFTVTNTGSTTQPVRPQLVTLGAPTFDQTYALALDPAVDPTFVDGDFRRYYVEQDFPVGANVQRLDAALAFRPGIGLVRLSLIDPLGRLVAFSDQLGANGYGHISVHDPIPGAYRAFLWATSPPVNSAPYKGPIQLRVTERSFVSAGFVVPLGRVEGRLGLPPGSTEHFLLALRTPAQPGDMSAEVRFYNLVGTGLVAQPSPAGAIPISLRSLVPVGSTGGGFSGTVLGGNGNGTGQELSYQFDVPAGLRDLDLSLTVSANNNNLEGVLVDPNNQPVDVQSTITAQDPNTGAPTAFTNTLQFFHRDPVPGRWLFVLVVNETSAGVQTQTPFHATVAFDQAQVSATGLPNSSQTTLAAGKTVVVPV
ncbi:MAG TPA: S8 family serine peptidase, partial [Chloroflexota bacterium]|nr:S8 family serine peptidase [Chloroflexota bacterium]